MRSKDSPQSMLQKSRLALLGLALLISLASSARSISPTQGTAGPDPGFLPRGQTFDAADIWTDSERNGFGTTITSRGPDGTPTESGDQPWPGDANRVYARVHNFGDATARNLRINFYVHQAVALGDSGPWQLIGRLDFFGPIPPRSFLDGYVDWTPENADPVSIKVEIQPLSGEMATENNLAIESTFFLDMLDESNANEFEVAIPIPNQDPNATVSFDVEIIPQDQSNDALPKTAQPPAWYVRTERVERLPNRQDIQIYRILVSSLPCTSFLQLVALHIRLIPRITVGGRIVFLPALSFTPRRPLLQMELICPTQADVSRRFDIIVRLIPCSAGVSFAGLTASVQVDSVCGYRQVINQPLRDNSYDPVYDFTWLNADVLTARGYVYGNRLFSSVETSPCEIKVGTLEPGLQCPAPQTLRVGHGCTAIFNEPAIGLDSCTGSLSMTTDPPLPATFGVGTHTVTYTATDRFGNTASCSTTVTVVDSTPPIITCPADFTMSCATASGAPVLYTATATDNCDPAAALTCSPASGNTFPLGTTAVTCTATDASGNGSTCSFTVTTALNNPPTANAGGDQIIVVHAADVVTVTLNGTGSSDPDGQPLTYLWEQISGPAVALDNPHSPTPSYQQPIDYVYREFRLTVTDPCGVTATDTVRVFARYD